MDWNLKVFFFLSWATNWSSKVQTIKSVFPRYVKTHLVCICHVFYQNLNIRVFFHNYMNFRLIMLYYYIYSTARSSLISTAQAISLNCWIWNRFQALLRRKFDKIISILGHYSKWSSQGSDPWALNISMFLFAHLVAWTISTKILTLQFSNAP